MEQCNETPSTLILTARRCGVLQPRDRILSINGYPCDQCTVDEVNQLLSDAYSAGQVWVTNPLYCCMYGNTVCLVSCVDDISIVIQNLMESTLR